MLSVLQPHNLYPYKIYHFTEILTASQQYFSGSVAKTGQFTLAPSEPFHRIAFSRQAVPKTLVLFTEYDELDRLWPLFVVENKESVSTDPG